MKLTPRQSAAINQIIMDEVQDALKGRSMVSEHLSRGLLFEEVGSYEVVESRKKVEEAASLLSEARSLLEADSRLLKHAEEAFEATYILMTMLDEEMGGDDGGRDEPVHDSPHGGYTEDGEADDAGVPPMHPRKR
jgi:hypothetical protein